MTEIKPALSAEEWEDMLSWPYGVSDAIIRPAEMLGYGHNTPEDRHHVAALALHGQPFGFTWDDVDLLRMFSDGDPMEHIRRECNDLADRIAALLPPRG